MLFLRTIIVIMLFLTFLTISFQNPVEVSLIYLCSPFLIYLLHKNYLIKTFNHFIMAIVVGIGVALLVQIPSVMDFIGNRFFEGYHTSIAAADSIFSQHGPNITYRTSTRMGTIILNTIRYFYLAVLVITSIINWVILFEKKNDGNDEILSG